ncbi:porin [Glaciimonas immobilis]|nr:porin [Glaciimonas immobilis]
MKKLLISLAALGCASAASAQSSVTVFGVLDADISHYSQGGVSKTIESTSGNGPSSLGFRGTEDLGGGLSANFWMEAALLNDTGAFAGSALFGRRSTISIAGNFGEVRLGRDAPPSWWNNVVFDAFGGAGPGSATNITKGGGSNGFNGTNPLAFTRVNNAIQYIWGVAPNGQTAFGNGIYGNLMYVFPENVSGTAAIGQYTGARLGYTNGPMNAAVSYAQSKGAPLPGAAGLSTTFKDFNLGGSYVVGVAKLTAHVGVNNSDVTRTKYTHWGVGASIFAGAGSIPVSYNSTKQNNAAGDGADQFAIGYVYNLSKRTVLYTAISHIRNKNNGTYTFLGGNGGGNPGLQTAFGGGRSFGSGTGTDFGIRTTF